MSYIPNQFALMDGVQLDSAGRLRVSNPTALVSIQQEYTSAPLLVENYVAGTATATYTQTLNGKIGRAHV